MKPISEMTLAECIDRLRELPNGTVDDANDAVMLPGVPWIFDVAGELADRIHDLILWIPVEERLPDNESAVKVWVGYETYGKWCESSNRWFVDGPLGRLPVTHWRRIDTP